MNTTTIPRPSPGEYHAYYQSYISLVPDGDLLGTLQQQAEETLRLLRGVTEEKSTFAYAPGKWTVRQVIGHVTDAERVFAYRALSFARGDKGPLPSFEEESWAATSNAAHRKIAEHVDDFLAVRAATLALLRGLTSEDLERVGIASGNPVTPRALAWITAGHERHHVRVLRDRYGV